MITRQGTRIFVETPVTFGNVRKMLAAGLVEIETGALEVDLGKMEDADSSVISMMLEWMRAANRRKQSLSFFNMKQALRNLIGLYGLSGVIPQGDGAALQ